MALLIIYSCVLLLALAVGCGSHNPAKKFGSDYEWSDKAGRWLKYHAVPLTWDEARLRCIAEDAILASPLTEQMKTAIVTIVNNSKKHDDSSEFYIFTGVHAIFSKGDYASIEGKPLLRLAITWAPGEPDNYRNSERCLAMSISEDGAMADTWCTRVLPYVCYKHDTTLNVTECGTTDPKYVKEPRTGSCYKFHEKGQPWAAAYQTCVAEGGSLLVINNDVEAAVVRDIISKHWRNVVAYEKGYTYVGFQDWGHRGTSFMTVNGETLAANYHTWLSGQPDNQTRVGVGEEGQSCGAVNNDAALTDYFCGVPTGFICEKPSLENELKTMKH